MELLSGKIIISTLPHSSHRVLHKLLIALDANVLHIPMIEISAVTVTMEIKNVLENLDEFQWIVFTSKNGVSIFFKTIAELGIEFSDNLKTAVIGEKTGIEIQKHIPSATYVSNAQCSEKFAKELHNLIVPGDKVLLVLGQLAGSELEIELSDIANVCRINIYQTTKPVYIDKTILQRVKENKHDLLVFSSPSAFVNFISELVHQNSKTDLKMVSIGKTTTQTMLDYGYQPLITATESSINGIADEIINYYLKIKL